MRGERSVFIEDDPLAQLPLGESEHCDDDEQQDRQGRAVAEEMELEGLLVEVIDQHGGAHARAALGQHGDLGEDLERADNGDDRGQQDGRRDQR
ncbi:hypothetical protein D9M68_996860 [compost metagenome]